MIKSMSSLIDEIYIPDFYGEIKMVPFRLDNIHFLNGNIPYIFLSIVKKMTKFINNKNGIAFLTVDGKFIKKGETHRRPGIHIDGNYIENISDWCGGGNGWKVGEGGRELSSEHHKLSYDNDNGGMIIVSNYSSCMGWNGNFKGNPGIGGDCSHLKIKKENGFILDANKIYYTNSKFVHETLPVDRDVHRTLIRITLPIDHKYNGV